MSKMDGISNCVVGSALLLRPMTSFNKKPCKKKIDLTLMKKAETAATNYIELQKNVHPGAGAGGGERREALLQKESRKTDTKRRKNESTIKLST
jgi:hypothetical protein